MMNRSSKINQILRWARKCPIDLKHAATFLRMRPYSRSRHWTLSEILCARYFCFGCIGEVAVFAEHRSKEDWRVLEVAEFLGHVPDKEIVAIVHSGLQLLVFSTAPIKWSSVVLSDDFWRVTNYVCGDGGEWVAKDAPAGPGTLELRADEFASRILAVPEVFP